jgi:glycosyltransferase involved in cell wall biosynthesis
MVLPLLHARVPCGHVTIVNAMYMSKAVVATASQGVADYIREGDNGLLVPPGDADALAQRIEQLWGDEALADKLGAAGRDFAERHCSERSTIDYVSAYLRSLRPDGGHRAGVQAVSVGM